MSERKIPKLAILGPGRCGKDTAGEFLRDVVGLRFAGGCSWAGREYMAEKLGISVEEAWATRHQRRMEWYDGLNEYRKNDPARLVRKVLETSDFVCGIRDSEEFFAAKEEGLLDLAVWVSRSAAPFDPTIKFGPESCDIVITNDTTITDYLAKWLRLARALGMDLVPTAEDLARYVQKLAKSTCERALTTLFATAYGNPGDQEFAPALYASMASASGRALEQVQASLAVATAPGC